MSLVTCTITRSDGTSISFDFTQILVFAGAVPINVASYHYEVVIQTGEVIETGVIKTKLFVFWLALSLITGNLVNVVLWS